jgi:hypothetical protein
MVTATKRYKCVHGFQTGDIVKAVVPIGKKAGTYLENRRVVKKVGRLEH